MPFVITASGRPGALQRRLRVQPAHLDCRSGEARINPLLHAHGRPVGRLPIVATEQRAAAEALRRALRERGGVRAGRDPALAHRGGLLQQRNGRWRWLTG